ncbi:putative membrane transporter protein [Trypanosoma rangeli]|uniref:Putative membrane transporter protein n=1 Tax=Trypanosoma rangeli TaxID=5698 RepID=A0A422NPU3_TRYRA|nr:putative membrane transporter protein [Trypanosoma rangeli]RNF07451.1 putative membrane transporter protein [Trypanosoma rangeli]|eukprot:RNF07451.1 putative membrane transporter protein [Trypanosoma rangeli]
MGPEPHWERGENVVQTSTGTIDGRVPIYELLRQTLKVAVPSDVISVLWIASQVVIYIYMYIFLVEPFLGEEGLPQYNTGIPIFNVTTMSMPIVSGLSSAIYTITSQAFGHNLRSTVTVETLRLELVVNFCVQIIMSVAFLNSEPVMDYAFRNAVGKDAARFLGASPLYLHRSLLEL